MTHFRIYNNQTHKSTVYLILNELLKITHDFNKKKEMTQSVKLALVRIGHQLNFKVYARVYTDEYWSKGDNQKRISDEIGIEKNLFKNKEWLYDIHWYTDIENPDNNRALHYMPKSFELACECEWSKNKAKSWTQNMKDIGYDFQKLLFSNARLNVFICRCYTDIEIKSLADYFNKSIQEIDNLPRGSQFLIACFREAKLFYLKVNKKVH